MRLSHLLFFGLGALAIAGRAEANVDIVPPFVAFGAVPVNGKPKINVKVKNIGADSVQILKLVLVNNGAWPVFDLWPPPIVPLTIIPGGELSFDVTATAPAVAWFDGEVRIETDDPNDRFIRIPLDVTGTQVGITIRPTTLSFLPLMVGQVSLPMEVEVCNMGRAGDDTLSIEGAMVMNAPGSMSAREFSALDTGKVALDGAKCLRIPVSFQPTTEGSHSALLIIKAGNFTPPQVKLVGMTVLPTIEVELGKASLGFTYDGGAATKVPLFAPSDTITVKLRVPPTSPPATITEIRSSDAQFVVDVSKTMVGTTIAPGWARTFDVAFIPTKAGLSEGLLAVWLRDVPDPVPIKVYGVGIKSMVVTDVPDDGCSMSGRAAGGTLPLALAALLLVRRRRERVARS